MGLESLAMVALNALQQKTVRRVLIIAFDSSFPFAVGSDRLDHFPEGFTLFNYDISRIPGIMEERALAYRRLYFRTMTAQGVLPDERRVKFLQLRHIDAVWKDDMSDLPDSCKKEEVKLTNPPMVTKRLANVVTRLWLESACDRDLVATARGEAGGRKQRRDPKILAAAASIADQQVFLFGTGQRIVQPVREIDPYSLQFQSGGF